MTARTFAITHSRQALKHRGCRPGTVDRIEVQPGGAALELTIGARQPMSLPHGVSRGFLEDGDRVTMTGWCQGSGYRVGFGEVAGSLLPAG